VAALCGYNLYIELHGVTAPTGVTECESAQIEVLFCVDSSLKIAVVFLYGYFPVVSSVTAIFFDELPVK
jgi:hypothetical protein